VRIGEPRPGTDLLYDPTDETDIPRELQNKIIIPLKDALKDIK